jgi:tetratricopeptide (TPR) repeat protein
MSGRAPLCRSVSTLVLVLALALPLASFAQQAQEDFNALREKAFQMIEQGNQVGALPLLEKLTTMRPQDTAVLERLGGSLVAAATQTPDSAAKKSLRIRARGIFLQAQKLGDNSGYDQTMLQQLPENGEVPAFSQNKEVDQAMSEGEAAFAKGDFQGTLKSYEHAYQLDPANYTAALFAGDALQQLNQIDKAGEWFSKAVQIDSNRETAYRYWGNSLMRLGKSDEALPKYIQAIVAEPYSKASWTGLIRWGDATKTKLGHPAIEIKDSGSAGAASNYWAAYPATRAAWQGGKFQKEFPNEKEYPHSLREETEALGAVASLVSRDASGPAKQPSITPDLQALARLRDQGLLEAFVLLSKPDNGVALDYAGYRAQNRDKLANYVSQWLIWKEPAR